MSIGVTTHKHMSTLQHPSKPSHSLPACVACVVGLAPMAGAPPPVRAAPHTPPTPALSSASAGPAVEVILASASAGPDVIAARIEARSVQSDTAHAEAAARGEPVCDPPRPRGKDDASSHGLQEYFESMAPSASAGEQAARGKKRSSAGRTKAAPMVLKRPPFVSVSA